MQSVSPPGTAPRPLVDDRARSHNGAPPISDDLAMALYEHMVAARVIDERLAALQLSGRVLQHASALGQEAAVIGAVAAVRDDDWVFLGSPEFGAALWRGMPVALYAHRAFGTATDVVLGRSRIPSPSPRVGRNITHAVGVAWAARLRRHDLAVLLLFGESATSGHDFHAGLNFAGVARVPLIALCWNGGPAASSRTAVAGVAAKAVAYGLPAVRVDGCDVIAVWSAVREARARASAGGGATLIEAVGAPPGDGENPELGAARDPVARFRRTLEERGCWGEDRERQLREGVNADVQRAIAEAEMSPVPAPDTLFDNVYADVPRHLREQRDEWARVTGAFA
ncbi:MAG: thiamine pyrophosphate-dependent enzyme [Polyangiaceae bacterium]|jgi:2-oxoisovalerate dehydrogenase E1 component alpha subunit